jgi:small-conductance mechanosensitive channel
LAEAWHRFRLDLALFTPRVLSALAILVAFWVVGHVASGVLRRLGGTRGIDPDLMGLLGRAARVTLILVGVVTAMGTVGIDVKALVTGLGLTGFAVGFALRDIIANTLAGILILAYRPFRRGDHIAVTGIEGTIIEIDLRYTIVEGTPGSTRVLVPNQTLFTNAITVTPGTVPPSSRSG